MKIVLLSLKDNPYKILIGTGILSELGVRLKSLKLGTDAIIITNPVVRHFYGVAIKTSLKAAGFSVKVLTVPDGEQSKSAQTAFELMEKIAKYDVFKRPFILAVGGGVIGDLAGYVAAAYKRGIPYVQVPTTFLAQIDSAIGGKVAIDLPIGKNLVGAFYQPRMVFSDVATLASLDQRQIRNGLAEAIKYGIIYDQNLFTYITKNYQKLLQKDLCALMHVVTHSSQIKAEVVEADEKETKNIRTILNFGHTVGHAIEAAGKYTLYQHGEAIALGMRIAAAMSLELKLCTEKEVVAINQILSVVGLPEKISQLRLTEVLKVMKHDKKFVAGTNRFVFVQKIGKVKVLDDIPLSIIQKAIRAFQ